MIWNSILVIIIRLSHRCYPISLLQAQRDIVCHKASCWLSSGAYVWLFATRNDIIPIILLDDTL